MSLSSIVGLSPARVGADVAAAAPQAESSACTESGVTWRIDFTYDGGFGGVVRVDGLTRTESGTTTDAAGLTWQLRWDNTPEEWPPATPSASVVPFHQVEGPLSSFSGRWVSVFLSPRLVSPDGVCTVYLTPFAGVRGLDTDTTVAVLGDDLLQQLNDSDHNREQQAWQGFVEANLAPVGVRVEVEGQGADAAGQLGRRWTEATGTSGLDKANGYLLDEYRGLLEHDTDGFVMALGMNDALYIAAGATQADREARRDEVFDRLGAVWSEIGGRSGCLEIVTTPENASSAPNYAWAAGQVNNFWRWVTAAGGSTDPVELVDLGGPAETEGWFAEDKTLSALGKLVYTHRLTQAARRCTEAVTIHGAAGTFGDLAGKAALPSGQALRTQAVSGWGFPGGKTAWFSAAAADGTVFMMNGSNNAFPVYPTGTGMGLGAYQPSTNQFEYISFTTDRGRSTTISPVDRWRVGDDGVARYDPDYDRGDGRERGMDIGDVAAFDDGNAIVFTGGAPYWGQELEPEPGEPGGQWPSFGILTKGSDGWELAGGTNPDGTPWKNQWSARELVAASDPVIGNEACSTGLMPDPDGNPVPDCHMMNELDVLPHSDDVVIAQYLPTPAHAGQPARASGKVTVLDVSPDPNIAGKYTTRIAATFQLPDVPDPLMPAGSGRHMLIAPKQVRADPSSSPGDERFALVSDMWRADDPGTPDVDEGLNPAVGTVIEFSYDAAAGTITPVSAPIVVDRLGEPDAEGERTPVGYGLVHYDRDGNLWASSGQGLGVFAKTTSGRRLSNGDCPMDPAKDLEDYQVGVPPDDGIVATWGLPCNPDYNLLVGVRGPQPFIANMEEDPVTHAIAVQDWLGHPYLVDPEGRGNDMTFAVSSPVHTTRGSSHGAVDRFGRLWFVEPQTKPADLPFYDMAVHTMQLDQWIFSVDTTSFWGRTSQPFTVRPGETTTLHAEKTRLWETTRQPGVAATYDIDSPATIVSCAEIWGAACADPVSGLTGGFAVRAKTPGGEVSTGVVAEYRVVVPKAGTYRVHYHATDRNQPGDQRIGITVDGTPHPGATIPPGATFQRDPGVRGPQVELSAGTHTIQITSPTVAASGWELDLINFTRTG